MSSKFFLGLFAVSTVIAGVLCQGGQGAVYNQDSIQLFQLFPNFLFQRPLFSSLLSQSPNLYDAGTPTGQESNYYLRNKCKDLFLTNQNCEPNRSERCLCDGGTYNLKTKMYEDSLANPTPPPPPTIVNKRKPQKPTYEYDDDEPSVENAATTFAWNLFQKVNPESPGKNVILSPISPQILLGNLLEFTDDRGKEQLTRAIKYSSIQGINDLVDRVIRNPSESTIKLDIATAYFIADDLKLKSELFKTLLNEGGVEMHKLDTKNPTLGAKSANDWVARKTRGIINEVLKESDINSAIRLLLVNAISFKGQWKYKFINQTELEFEYPNAPKKTIPVMYQWNKLRAADIASPSNPKKRIGQWVELPYDDENLSMVLVLPEKRLGLDEMVAKMTPNHIARIFDELRMPYISTKVSLKMPKFHIKATRSLVEPLKQLGLTSIFEGNALPRLSQEPTQVSDIKQQAEIDVDENGTTATAVSSLQIITLSIHPQYKDIVFNVDQPFLAMIMDKENQLPLFIIKVVNP